MKIESIDHIVLTVECIDTTCGFYECVLGMKTCVFADNRIALTFGRHKFNLHHLGQEFEPNAKNTTPGSADIYLVTVSTVNEIKAHLTIQNIAIE